MWAVSCGHSLDDGIFIVPCLQRRHLHERHRVDYMRRLRHDVLRCRLRVFLRRRHGSAELRAVCSGYVFAVDDDVMRGLPCWIVLAGGIDGVHVLSSGYFLDQWQRDLLCVCCGNVLRSGSVHPLSGRHDLVEGIFIMHGLSGGNCLVQRRLKLLSVLWRQLCGSWSVCELSCRVILGVWIYGLQRVSSGNLFLVGFAKL